MVAKIVLDEITSSGGTITVPTGKTMAITDAGNLTIGGVAITTGAQGVLSKTGDYTILPGDFTGKSSLIIFVNVSAGTSTETTITLPAEADFSTCAIHVVSTTTHGAGNKITIKNDTPVEVYTLYEKGDHCEFVSDGTTVFRTGNEWVTVTGRVYNNADGYPSMASTTVVRIWSVAAQITTDFNVGLWWDDATNFRITAAFDCDLIVNMHNISTSQAGMQPVLKHLDSGGSTVRWYDYPYSSSEGGYSQGAVEATFVVRGMSATDYLELYNANVHGSTQYFAGSADGDGAAFDFRVLRRR